ncbi:hypothetical protein [Pseudomonas guariconensis]|uniref:hypothetical protein n=1 Tax=Pseudomonas guariconensis TaxID=1288410 RepID=UPI002FE66C4B
MSFDKNDALFKIISRYDHYIEIANNKANYILASVISVNIALAALLGYAEILKFNISSPYTNIIKALGILSYLAFIIFSGVILLGVHKIIFPNTSSPSTSKPSDVFFGDVAKRDHEQYALDIKSLTTSDFTQDLSFQANALAKIVEDKFKNQKAVMQLTSRQFIASAFATSVLCAIIKALS